ncbi:hypothetical protein GBAR_LOCUS1051, partial [Geodia barretti]
GLIISSLSEKVTELGLYFLLEILSPPASTIPTIDICLLWAVLY